jgi:glycosyltransferase involved in cell wall biosynthesis
LKRFGSADVAVVIPAFNAEKWIADCLDSVLRQTMAPAEIIVINDGSTDQTAEILEQRFTGVPGLRVVHQTNKGPGAARNRGILESTASLIAFLDADDTWLPEKLRRQVESMELAGEAFGLCHTYAEVIDENGKLKKTFEEQYPGFSPKEIMSSDLAGRNVLIGSASSALIRRHCVTDVGLFCEVRNILEDLPYWYKISLHYRIVTIPEVLVRIRVHKSSMQKARKKELTRYINGIIYMKQNAPPQHMSILKEMEKFGAATLLVYSFTDPHLITKLFKKYGWSLVPSVFVKIRKYIENKIGN